MDLFYFCDFGLPEDDKKGIWKQAFAELIGTLVLVGFGISWCLYIDKKDARTLEEFAFGLGMVIYLLGEAFIHISGCQINPLFTIPWVILGKMPVLKGCFFLAAQVTGSLLAVFLVKALLPAPIQGHIECSIPPYLTTEQAFGFNFMYTFYLFIFVHSILETTDLKGGSLAFFFGVTIVGIVLSGGRWGLNIHPGWTLASAIMTNHWKNHWLFWGAPLSGAICGSLFWLKLFHQSVKITSLDEELIERMRAKEKQMDRNAKDIAEMAKQPSIMHI